MAGRRCTATPPRRRSPMRLALRGRQEPDAGLRPVPPARLRGHFRGRGLGSGLLARIRPLFALAVLFLLSGCQSPQATPVRPAPQPPLPKPPPPLPPPTHRP